MSKAFVLGSVLTVGAGASVGGMVWSGGGSGSQESYKTASLKHNEENLVDSELPGEQNLPKPQEQQECSVFSVVSSVNSQAKKEEFSFLNEKVKSEEERGKIDKVCKSKDSVYVANLGSGRGWGYRESDQGLSWRLVTQ